MKYYLHDTSAFDDEKVTELYMQFGYEGVGLFYVILEKLGKQEKPVKTIVLKKQLGIGKRLEKCWNFMEEIDLISSNNGETFNKQLLNFSEKYQIKKEKNAKRISEWRDKQIDTENVTCYKSVRNTPKVKISKVKGIYTYPTLQIVKDFFKENNYPEELAVKFYNGYSVADWKDSKGQIIKNWKQKAIHVWFKEENKIRTNADSKQTKLTEIF